MTTDREAIAAAGRAEAIARHTYRHRMERLLAEAERRLGRTVVAGSGREGLHRGGNAETIPPEGGTPAGNGDHRRVGVPPSGGPVIRRRFRLKAGLQRGTEHRPGWSSAFRRSGDPETIPPEGGTPAGDGESPGWSPAFRRSADPGSDSA